VTLQDDDLRRLLDEIRESAARGPVGQPSPAPGAHEEVEAWLSSVASARRAADADALAHHASVQEAARRLFGHTAADLLTAPPGPVSRAEIRVPVPASAQLRDVVARLDGVAPCGPAPRVPQGDSSIRVVIAAPPRPNGAVVVRLHGGAFWMGGGTVMDRIDRALVDHLALVTGATVLDVDHRLAPEHPFPAAIVDVLAVLELVRGPAAPLTVDASRIALVGTSSGSTIAAVTAMADAQRARSAPLAALAVIVPSMLLNDAPAAVRDDSRAWALRRRQLHGYLGADLDPSSPWVSPGTASALSDMPPTFAAIARHDEIAMGGERLCEAIVRGGGQATARLYDMTHTTAAPATEARMISDIGRFLLAALT